MKIHFLLTVICLLVFSYGLYPQDLKVNVVSDNHPLGYAYVFINGKIYSSADSVGVTYISENLLNDGDSISASFVGAESGSAKYSRGQMELTIELVSSFDMEDIIVVGKDRSLELYGKYVRQRKIPFWYSEFLYDFSILTPGGQKVEGKFRNVNLPDSSYYERTGEQRYSIANVSDATSSWDIVLGNSHFCALYSPYFKEAEGMIIKYMGHRKGKHSFFITRPYFDTWSKSNVENFQTLLYVDDRTREIVMAETDWVGKTHVFDIKMTAKYKVNNNLFPFDITATLAAVHLPETGIYDIFLFNGEYKPYPESRIYKAEKQLQKKSGK